MKQLARRRTRIPLALAAVLLGAWAVPASAASMTVRQVIAALRAGHPADLAGQDLSRLDLADLDLSGANLAGANLFGADLTGANLAGARPQLVLVKTALSAPTNRFLGGGAPSTYLRKLQDQQKLGPEQIDALLHTRIIDPARLRADALPGMMAARAAALAAEIAAEIAHATGRPMTRASSADIFGSKTTADDAGEEMAA